LDLRRLRKRKLFGLAILPERLPIFFLRLSAILLLPTGFLYSYQHKLLHHPEVVSRTELFEQLEAVGVKAWPSLDSYRGIMAWSGAARNVPAKGTVILFHGNSGSAISRTYYAENLSALGYRTVLLEYPGYGAREGELDEKTLLTDGAESVRRIVREFGKPVYVMGESLGSGVAAGVISRVAKEVNGAVLITPWDNLPNVAQSTYWYLPAKLLTREAYDSVANLQSFSGPLVIVMSEKDEIIPTTSTLNLYQSYSGRKKLYVMPGATHRTWYGLTSRQWWKETLAFLESGSNMKFAGY